MLSDDRAHHIIGNERRQLGRDVRHHISQSGFPAGFFRLLRPEIDDDRILAIGQFHPAKIFIRQNFGNFHQRRTGFRIVHDQQHRIAHILLEHWSAGRFEVIQLVENANHLVDDEGFLFRMALVIFQQIEAERTLSISRIE